MGILNSSKLTGVDSGIYKKVKALLFSRNLDQEGIESLLESSNLSIHQATQEVLNVSILSN